MLFDFDVRCRLSETRHSGFESVFHRAGHSLQSAPQCAVDAFTGVSFRNVRKQIGHGGAKGRAVPMGLHWDQEPGRTDIKGNKDPPTLAPRASPLVVWVLAATDRPRQRKPALAHPVLVLGA